MDAGSRRRLLEAISGLAMTLAPFAFPLDAGAKKHKKKKRAGLCPTVSSPPLTCAQTCPSDCDNCYIRPGASTQCGNDIIVVCGRPCSSDNDCEAGSGFPFCVSQVINRATGAITNACGTNPPSGFCHAISACG